MKGISLSIIFFLRLQMNGYRHCCYRMNCFRLKWNRCFWSCLNRKNELVCKQE